VWRAAGSGDYIGHEHEGRERDGETELPEQLVAG
jgi:hypothetical protein